MDAFLFRVLEEGYHAQIFGRTSWVRLSSLQLSIVILCDTPSYVLLHILYFTFIVSLRWLLLI